MLIKRLAEHAEHLRDRLPPPFYRERTVRWAIELDTDGRSRNPGDALVDLVNQDRPHGIVLPTPYIYRSGQKPPPTLIVDTLQYVVAMAKDDSAKAKDDAARRNDDYVELLHRWRKSAPDDPLAAAVCAFFDQGRHRDLVLPDEANPGDIVGILVAGEWAHLTETAIGLWQQVVRERKSGNGNGICLACGAAGPLLDTIPEPIRPGAIPVANGRGRDTVLVSINKPAQGRGGTIQLANTPVCHDCGGMAMAVLNSLLTERDHRYRTDDSVTVWWLREPAPISPLGAIRDARPEDIRAIYEELQKARAGHDVTGVDTNKFYAITLSANQSRVVVRDWIDVPLPRQLTNLVSWFDDHEMVDLWDDGLHRVGTRRMARSLGHWRRSAGEDGYVADTAPASAERELLTCGLRGRERRPPDVLLSRLLQRVRADGHIDLPRAALLRLLLNRRGPGRENGRTSDEDDPTSKEKPVSAALDPTNNEPAYVCGRVFAVLESIQYTALKDRATGRGPNATIADRFFGAAMTTPLAVMVMLRRNATGHLKRLRRENPGAAVALSNRLDTLFELVPPAAFPRTLDLSGQGRFVVGYHHQRAADRAAARGNNQD